MNTLKFNLPKVIAHRGASAYAPENTLAALRKAKEFGARWVEFDVMLTKYCEAIVFHDENLDRTTNGAGLVAKTPYALIATFDAGGWFGPVFKGERVPTLGEWLQCANSLDVGLNLEMKAKTWLEAKMLAEQVATEIARYWEGGFDKLLISSGSTYCLEAIYEYLPDVKLGYISSKWSKKLIPLLDKYHCISLHLNQKVITKEVVDQIKKTSRLCLAYTINDINTAKMLFDMGVDAIFSDDPKIGSRINEL